MPAEVDSPRNHRAAPENAGGAVIIGIHDDASPEAVTTKPWTMSLSALTSSIDTVAPLGTTTVGLVMPAMRKFSAGIEGLASTTRCTSAEVKVSRLAA